MMSEAIAIENTYASGAYTKRGLVLVRGKEEFVYDSQDKAYVDCIAGHGSVILGHANPAVCRAIAKQSFALLACPESFYNDTRAALLQQLIGVAPRGLQTVFLCNSGTEAVEGAIKLARLNTDKKQIIAAVGAFHGRTLGALSLTWKKEYRMPFEPLLPGVKHVRYNNPQLIREAIDDDTAAVILEPVLGEGGVRVPSPGYLKHVREICDEKGVLLILDEVQTGFGRTGCWFACQREKTVPDILCTAKGIANGIPMGAVLSRPELKFEPKVHASTFGGNPLACAASLAVIQELQKNDLIKKSAVSGEDFLQKLREIEGQTPVVEVRGLGLMIAIELDQPVKPYLQLLQREGVLCLPAGETVLRFLPPFCITQDSINFVCETLKRCLHAAH